MLKATGLILLTYVHIHLHVLHVGRGHCAALEGKFYKGKYGGVKFALLQYFQRNCLFRILQF